MSTTVNVKLVRYEIIEVDTDDVVIAKCRALQYLRTEWFADTHTDGDFDIASMHTGYDQDGPGVVKKQPFGPETMLTC